MALALPRLLAELAGGLFHLCCADSRAPPGQQPHATRRPEGLAAVAGRATAWRPWQLKELELIQATAISTPSCRHSSRGFFLLVSIQSGTSDNRYRNISSSDQGGEGTFRVFEPEETWLCRPRNTTFQCLTVDPTWLQQLAAEMP